MSTIKTTLIQIHKLTGSHISLLFLMWFLTGFILIFKGFPHASRQERFEHLTPLTDTDFESITAFPSTKGKVELEKYGDQPVFRAYSGRRNQQVIDASTQTPIPSFSQHQAQELAESFNGHSVKHIEHLNELDSWILWSYYQPLLPFYKCYLNDAAHTVLYVSAKSGTIIQETNRASRWWARLGAIPHWIYFKQLKSNENTWQTVVVILCVIGLLASLSGFWVAFYRIKRDENNCPVKLTVYKKWDYKWHHLLGWFLALLMSTFTLSGIFYTTSVPLWLSNKPAHSYKSQWNKASRSNDLMHPKTIWNQLPDKADVRKIAPSSAMGQPVVNVYYNDYRQATSYLVKHDTLVPFTADEAVIRLYAKHIFKDEELTINTQTYYDDYYEPCGMFYHPLPAYKIDVDDEYKTTLFIDPQTGKAVEYFDRNKRLRRWLTKGLHKFELPFLTNHDGLRKSLLIIVLLIGTFMCVTSVVLSWKWFKRIIK